ncbi:putative hydrolase [Stappia aggregata IAM 12614]|uniref:Putative hydrolase n=1 Tax=Roseibium aggregatum (strain ATCC 25650 / DSM 13394 / JCM 20685 / NBRC 16684 / NCIMB 2208 / IAM 12614 / B1) TaxID=384765 RepID=A0NV71_ROSAI|nr:HAD family phosphatase [Roseibium aggregatum]EAV43338.1 putative hydrolase [Stappia aggregata IAM 12614] [Roseibium aggregatum IAM 12614]
MPDIKFVIFDMDLVLYDYDHQIRLKLLEDLTGRPAAEIDQSVWGGPHENAAEAGNPATSEAYLKQFARLLEYPIDFETWADVRRQMMRARPDVLSLVRNLKRAADVALLTNNGMLLKEALPVCAPETVEIFGEKAHVSAEFGVRKPDPLIYERVCSRYGYRPEESAFVDDREENVEGALSAGLTGHLYETAEGLETFLRAYRLI